MDKHRPYLKIEYVPIDTIKEYPRNAKLHPAEQIEQIKKSITDYGFNDPIGIWKDEVVEGHGRLIAAKELGIAQVPVVRLDNLTDEQRREYALVHNQTTMNSGFDFSILDGELEGLPDFDAEFYGFDLVDVIDADPRESAGEKSQNSLSDKFIVPPFSILDTRKGYWRERKSMWENKIGDRGETRDQNVVLSRTFSKDKYTQKNLDGGKTVSILDPVLAEVICRWFTPYEGSNTFDVFAGDTVFGYVSASLGNNFVGIELREEQASINNSRVCGLQARYICDDGQNVLNHIPEDSQDLFFSCPPYFDLEVYSDLPNDASNQSNYNDFYKILDSAFSRAATCLKDNRFAVVVCGDIRNRKNGEYYGFTEDVKRTFRKNGFCLYNELILINADASAMLRASRFMNQRKVVKIHQNVLVFYKGNTKKIKEEFPTLEVTYEGEDMEFSQMD